MCSWNLLPNRIFTVGDICYMELYNKNYIPVATTIFNRRHLAKVRGYNRWAVQNRTNHPYISAHTKQKGRSVLLHRLIVDPPKEMFADHKNGDTFNNLDENLRVCSRRENNRNSKVPKKSPTGFKGVSLNNGRWMSRIRDNSGSVYLGTYDTPEKAALAYNNAAIKLHGNFARLNNLYAT